MFGMLQIDFGTGKRNRDPSQFCNMTFAELYPLRDNVMCVFHQLQLFPRNG